MTQDQLRTQINALIEQDDAFVGKLALENRVMTSHLGFDPCSLFC
jgi:hypothetical protein